MIFNSLGIFAGRAAATPYAISLGLGLASSSYFFWGNVATYFMGAGTIALDKDVRKKLGVDTSKAVEIWSWFYVQGAKHMGISGVVSALSVMYAALQVPASSLYGFGGGVTRKYLLVVSLTLLSSGLYTVGIMLPTNNRIMAIRDRITSARSTAGSSESVLTVTQEQEAENLLQKWKRMHNLRILTGGIGWAATLAAYSMTI